jgi:Ulp1 family protease
VLLWCPACRWIELEVLAKAPEADRRRFHFFNSFFYKKLSEQSSEPAGRPTRLDKARRAHERVKTWTKVRLGLIERRQCMCAPTPRQMVYSWS